MPHFMSFKKSRRAHDGFKLKAKEEEEEKFLQIFRFNNKPHLTPLEI